MLTVSSGWCQSEWTLDEVNAAPQDWREVDPNNLVYMRTTKGEIVLEIFPELAPQHAARVQDILKKGLYDGTNFHRVIKGFMAQGGDIAKVRSDAPEFEPIPGEFTMRRDPSQLSVLPLDPSKTNDATWPGYINGFAVITSQEALQDYTYDKRVDTWMPHCPGIVSMARTNNPNSATDQFFLVRDDSRFLDQNYTSWGRILQGLRVAKALNVGEPPSQPDLVSFARVAADMPDSQRPRAYVMETNSAAFAAHLENAKAFDTICDAPSVPTVVVFPLTQRIES